jgi:hypothetical protein
VKEDFIMSSKEILFPAFSRYVKESGVADRAKGNLAAKLPRILGQGKTKAVGLDLPPSEIERKMELATFEGSSAELPKEVLEEIEGAKADVKNVKSELLREEGKRRIAVAALSKIQQPNGTKDGKYFANGLILNPGKSGMEWSWSVTPYYSIINRIPPDAEYIVAAFSAAQKRIGDLVLSPEEFEVRLNLAWLLARHFSRSDDVLMMDVMKMFNVAGQDQKFWQSPQRQFYKDLPEAAFAVNLINWRMRSESAVSAFEFVPATLHQAHGPGAKVFYMPMNAEGTDVRPMVYLRKRSAVAQMK